jgi:hypothetical protein
LGGAEDFFAAAFLIIAVAVAIRGLPWEKLKTLGARSWPMSQGKIESVTVIPYHVRYFTYYEAQLAYSYSVDGEYYSGFYKKFFLRESSANRFTDALREKSAFIRSNPKSADVSTLLREDQQSVWPLQV